MVGLVGKKIHKTTEMENGLVLFRGQGGGGV